MLSLLHIENIAVIESADIQFDKGFNALTGETGAGKSIVVDAIGAIIGERTSRDLIRTGARSALVNAVFTGLPPLAWFQENGGGPDEDGNLLIQREIQPDGKNVCRLNGRLITVAQLRQLGRQLLNIHGQHDGQQLLDERCHLEYLDGFGETGSLQEEYRAAFGRFAVLRREIAAEVAAWVAGGKRTPHLVAILVGNDGASQTYVGHKEKCCGEVGFRSTVLRLPEETSEEALLGEIARLNADPQVDGFIVQLPLPKHISEQRVIEAIDPRKDVDGFHPVNTGRMISGLPSYLPATPDGILELLKYYGIETAGRHCVVIGRSNIVGRPIANLLSQKGWDCTVTLCHSRTKDLKEVVRGGDIVIAALGKAEFVTADMVKDGAVVVDVGITRVPSDKTKSGWKLLGDVKFDEVAPKCSYITPVPGGVGPMTIISLMKNTLKAARREVYK